MNKKLCSELVKSMTQMNEIVRGKRAPSGARLHYSVSAPPGNEKMSSPSGRSIPFS